MRKYPVNCISIKMADEQVKDDMIKWAQNVGEMPLINWETTQKNLKCFKSIV